MRGEGSRSSRDVAINEAYDGAGATYDLFNQVYQRNSMNLSTPEIDRLERMIESAHFFELPALIPSKSQPDRFEYQITVERNGKKHSVTAEEPALPTELKPLVDWLMGAGKPAK